MSDIWHQPESLGNGPEGPREHHTAAYVIALVVLLAIAGGVVRIATHSSSKGSASPASGLAPVGSPTPNTQETPPLATPSPGSSAPGAPTSSTPGLVADYRSAMARARAAKSVHSIADQTLQNGLRLRFDDLDGATSGSQRISIGNAVGLVRVVGPDSYFKGSAQVMAAFFGTTTQAAIADHDRWVHLTKSDRGYSSVTVNVTLSSTLDQIELGGSLKRLPAQTKDGQRVYGIQGSMAGPDGSRFTGTLWVAMTGARLPVEFDETGPNITRSVQRFMGWGAPVSVTTPPNPVDGKGAFAAVPNGGESGPGVPV